MRGAVLYGPRDVRFEDRETPRIEEPTDAVIRISRTCVCGSDLWPYRGLNPIPQPTPMGHEYCGVVEEVGMVAVHAARPMGVKRIIAMSRHEKQQEHAREFGATDIVVERGGEGVRSIEDMADGVRDDSVLECVGTQESMKQAINCDRKG